MKKKIAYVLIGACLIAGSFFVGKATGNSNAIAIDKIDGAYVTGNEITLELTDGSYFQYYMDSQYLNPDSYSFKQDYLDLNAVEYVEWDGDETNIYLEDGNWYTLVNE